MARPGRRSESATSGCASPHGRARFGCAWGCCAGVDSRNRPAADEDEEVEVEVEGQMERGLEREMEELRQLGAEVAEE